MGANSKIEWTDHTFNPWVGCTKVSPGCDGCYAEGWAKRAGRDVWGPGKPRERTSISNWRLPHKWDAEAKAKGEKAFVFVASLADVFDNEVDPDWRRDLFALIRDTPNLVWLVLTKRVGNVVRMMQDITDSILDDMWPGNAWLGATIVNQDEADRDSEKLIRAQAELVIPRTFFSVEPMLGPVNFRSLPPMKGALEYWRYDALAGEHWMIDERGETLRGYGRGRVDWVICGGESGRGEDTRPMHPEWARQLRDQCAAAGTDFMFKQWGEWVPGGHPAALAMGDFSMRSAMEISTKGGQFPDGQSVWRVGKKAAGRLLDGVEHNGRPQP